MLQITKLSGLAAASITFLFIPACTEKTAEVDSESTSTEIIEFHPLLRNEIQKILREEKHDSKALRDSLRGMTWEQAKPIWEEEEKKYESVHGNAPKKESTYIVALKIRTALSNIAIEKAEARSKQALDELDRGLKEMAEKEGRLKK